ncbi:XdhC/CoxI family protein [Myceligenerans crystallogenes]
MRDVMDELLGWWRAGRSVGMGTVVGTFRSAPRPPGAVMLVGPGDDGTSRAVGSVSGGCVEGAVFDLAHEVAVSGGPVLRRYGISDDDAFAVGLTCGGILDVFTERVDRESFPELGQIADDVAAGRPVAVATLVEHPVASLVGRRMVLRPGGAASSPTSAGPAVLASARMDDAVRDDALGLLAGGLSETITYGPDGERRGAGARVFVASFAPRPRLLVFGAIDFAAATARMGSFLGYHVTVCDARPLFATATRFPGADEVVTDWPHRYLRAEAEAGRVDGRTVICVLTHDPKFDVPVLEIALGLDAAYVGAMGSRRTHDDRLARLREAGVPDDALARLHSPIGLDLGARTPEETAVSIAAEIVSTRWGGSGRSLTARSGPIHAGVGS